MTATITACRQLFAIPKSPALYPHQNQSVEDICAAFDRGHRSVMFVLPTGGGKTRVFSHITQQAAASGYRVLILVHRIELLDQASQSLAQMGVSHGLIAANRGMDLSRPVQVGSIQTVGRRLGRFPGFDLVVVDECHHSSSRTWANTIGHFKHGGSLVLGVTATPCRTDGQGLGKHFTAMVQGPTAEELTSAGYLASARLLGPPIGFSADGIRKTMGDYDMSQAAKALEGRQIMGDAVSHFKKYLPNGTAIAFCCSVAHAEGVAAMFNRKGIKAASIDGKMDAHQRRQLLDRLATGKIRVLTSCALIGEGVDVPSVGGCILLRPTQSLSLHLQMIGRALRPSPGKRESVILDHVGNLQRLGTHLDAHPWSLDGVPNGGRDSISRLRLCPKCFTYCPSGAMVCKQCGHRFNPGRLDIETFDGELQELTGYRYARMRIKAGDTVWVYKWMKWEKVVVLKICKHTLKVSHNPDDRGFWYAHLRDVWGSFYRVSDDVELRDSDAHEWVGGYKVWDVGRDRITLIPADMFREKEKCKPPYPKGVRFVQPTNLRLKGRRLFL